MLCLYVFCLIIHSLIEAYVTHDMKCWSTEDIRLRKDGFISCADQIIIVKYLDMIPGHGPMRSHCPDFLKIYQITKCTGLRNTCNRNDVDILAIFEEYVNNCPDNLETICIFYDCISGPIRNLVNSQALTRPSGSYFQAVQFSGFLQCSFYGDISQITLYKTESADILVRSQNGSRMLDYKNMFCYNFTNGEYSDGLFKCCSNLIQVEAISISIYSGQMRNITLLIEGVILYQCRNSTHEQETNVQIQKLISTLNDDECGWFSKELLPWTSTLFSSALSLILIVVYIIKCLSWKKLKGTSSKTMSTVHLTSSHQRYLRRNVTDNNYETPHHYTEIQV